jgi:hypothetical protein
MKFNPSLINSIALLSSITFVMAEESRNVIDGTTAADKKAIDYVLKKDEDEYEYAPKEHEYEADEEDEDEDEAEKEAEEESEKNYADDSKDYTEYEADGSETRTESDGTTFERDPDAVYSEGLKLTFSLLAGLAALFAI